MAEQYRKFMDYLWVQQEDNVFTIGIHEDGLEEIEKLESIDLPQEGEVVEADVVLGTLDTDRGPLDLYSPVAGSISEVNSSVLEDLSLIQDDPYDAWLFKVESDDDLPDEDEDDDYDEEDEDDEEDLDEDDEEDEEDDED